MKKVHNGSPCSPLDPASEIILSWEREGFPQTDWTAFSFKGSCDIDALKAALQEALRRRPVFRSHLVVSKRFGLQTYRWRIASEPCPLEVTDLRGIGNRPVDMEQWTQQTLAPVVERYGNNLATEYPARFLLMLLPDDHGCFAVVWHHASTDGGGLYDFLRGLFSEYHRLVKGEDPEWANVAGLHSQTGRGEEIEPMHWGRFFKEAAVQLIRYPVQASAQLISSPSGPPERHVIRFRFDDPLLQEALRQRARRDQGTLSDLCLAAAKLALQEWNECRGNPPRVMHHWLAVNQRLRQSRIRTDATNNPLIAINIPSLPGDRKDPQALLRQVIGHRRRMLAEGFDVALYRLANGMTRAGRVLPIAIRHPVLRRIMDHRLSFFLSNVGVVWPRIENGKVTGETAIRVVGDMELEDIHSSIGTTFNNPICLILRTFLGRLYFNFTTGRHRISDADGQAFSQLVVDKVMAYL